MPINLNRFPRQKRRILSRDGYGPRKFFRAQEPNLPAIFPEAFTAKDRAVSLFRRFCARLGDVSWLRRGRKVYLAHPRGFINKGSAVMNKDTIIDDLLVGSIDLHVHVGPDPSHRAGGT